MEPWNKNAISFKGDSLTICHPSLWHGLGSMEPFHPATRQWVFPE